MSTSSIKRLHLPRPALTALAIGLLLSGCASHPTAPEGKSEHVVSKYAAEREGQAAGSSNAAHIPPVPHSPAAEKQAQAATPNYVLALQAMHNKDYQKALIIFQSITSRYPLLSGPLVNEGLIYLEQAKYDDAETVLKQAVKVNAQNPYAWNTLGLAQRQLGKFEDAKKAYQQALLLDPLYARAHFNLAVLADLYLDDLPLALTHYERYQGLQAAPDKNVSIWITDLQRRSGSAEKTAQASAPKAATSTPAQPATHTDKTP